MIGAIIGDIVGSRFEFRNRLSKEFDFMPSDKCKFTDDTVMTCAVAQAILDCNGNYDDLSDKAIYELRAIGQKYPNCGYGQKFVQWMFSENPKPYNSMGNGAAMRISPVGFVASSLAEVKELSNKVTNISHNHPEGIKGAEATAVAIFLAREGKTKDEIKAYIEADYYPLNNNIDQIRAENYYNELCDPCVPQAISCFLEGNDFEDTIRNCISIGGDSDTIAAIAGGIAEAYFGIPEEIIKQAESFLDDKLLSIYREFQKNFII